MKLQKLSLLFLTVVTLSACGSATQTATNNTVTENESNTSETNTAESESEVNTTESLHVYLQEDGKIFCSYNLAEAVDHALQANSLSVDEYRKTVINKYYDTTLEMDNRVIYNDIIESLVSDIVAEIENTIPVKELNQTMYATGSVNTRSGDSTDYEKIGSLTLNQEVLVTGQSERTGWYRINVNGQEMYVSNNYLSTEKTVVAPPPSNNGGGSGTSSSNEEPENWEYDEPVDNSSANDWGDLGPAFSGATIGGDFGNGERIESGGTIY